MRYAPLFNSKGRLPKTNRRLKYRNRETKGIGQPLQTTTTAASWTSRTKDNNWKWGPATVNNGVTEKRSSSHTSSNSSSPPCSPVSSFLPSFPYFLPRCKIIFGWKHLSLPATTTTTTVSHGNLINFITSCCIFLLRLDLRCHQEIILHIMI